MFGCLAPFSRYATPAQSERWDQHLRDGTIVGALAVTEASGGSSLENIETNARDVGDGYVLNGRKTLIGNAEQAGLFIVLGRQFPDRGPLGLTAFVVPRDIEGVTTGPLFDGADGNLGQIEFKDCLLSREAVLGTPGAGLRVFSTAMLWERSCLLAGFLGAAERDLARCVDVLRSRGEKNTPLLQHQSVSHRLARMKLELESARLMAYHAASHLDDGGEDYVLAAMTKVAVSEAVMSLAANSLRVLAGTAWRDESLRFLSAAIDAFGGLFASGTSEMQLEMIARSLLAEQRSI
jgi:alkylation response protein AidB-like acyl-CoA dehydrogenase